MSTTILKYRYGLGTVTDEKTAKSIEKFTQRKLKKDKALGIIVIERVEDGWQLTHHGTAEDFQYNDQVICASKKGHDMIYKTGECLRCHRHVPLTLYRGFERIAVGSTMSELNAMCSMEDGKVQDGEYFILAEGQSIQTSIRNWKNHMRFIRQYQAKWDIEVDPLTYVETI